MRLRFFRNISGRTTLLSALILGSQALGLTPNLYAQDDVATRKSLFPSQVPVRAESGPAGSTSGRFDLSRGLTLDDVVETQYHADGSVDQSLVNIQRQQGAMTFIKNTYDPNVDDVVNTRAIDALNLSDDSSRKLAAYESVLVISRMLAASPLAETYLEISNDFRTVQNFLMMRVSPGRDGSLEFESKNEYGSHETFLEFRLNPSTQHGVEPRLRMGNHVAMAYELGEHAVMLEYDINF